MHIDSMTGRAGHAKLRDSIPLKYSGRSVAVHRGTELLNRNKKKNNKCILRSTTMHQILAPSIVPPSSVYLRRINWSYLWVQSLDFPCECFLSFHSGQVVFVVAIDVVEWYATCMKCSIAVVMHVYACNISALLLIDFRID